MQPERVLYYTLYYLIYYLIYYLEAWGAGDATFCAQSLLRAESAYI
jgi:hypothetical protein